MRRKRIIFIILALLFFLTFMPVVLLDLNLHIFGEGLWISKSFITSVFFVALIFWIIIMTLFYLVFAKEYKVMFKNKYYTSAPYDYSPVIMTLLNAPPNIGAQGIVGLVSYFCSKSYVNIVEEKPGGFALYRSLDTEAFDGLENHEKYLIEWFFNDIGDGSMLSCGDFARYAQKKDNISVFCEKYVEWNAVAAEDINKYEFYFRYKWMRFIGKSIGAAYIITGVLLAYIFDKSVFFIFFFLGLIFFGYCKGINKRTKLGQEHFEKWMAYKRYLKTDFMNITVGPYDFRELKNDLPYIFSMGISKDVLRKINSSLESQDTEQMEDIKIGREKLLFFENIYDIVQTILKGEA